MVTISVNRPIGHTIRTGRESVHVCRDGWTLDREGLSVTVKDAYGVTVFAGMNLPDDGMHARYSDWAKWNGYPVDCFFTFERTIEGLIDASEDALHPVGGA